MAEAAKTSELNAQLQSDADLPIADEAAIEVAPASETAKLPSRPSLKWLARLACGLLLVALLWRHEQAADGSQSLARAWKLVSWPVLLLAVAWYWGGQVLSAWKWRMLLRAQGVAVSLRECCRWYAVGMFWNLWMPTNIGGDAVRVVLAAPRCHSRALAASSVLVERLTGFVALLCIGAVALVVDAFHFPGAGRAHGDGAPWGQALRILWMASGALACLVLLWLIVGFAARRLEGRAPENRFVRRLTTVRIALESFGRREMRRTLAWAMLMSFCFQASQIALNIGLARAVGLDVRTGVFWWLVPLLALASLLPLGIGGLGVREAAALALLAGTGADRQTIVLWSLLWQATVWLASLPGLFWRSSPHESTTDATTKNAAT